MPATMPATSLFDLAERKLDWLDRRQSVLASNIANADTPQFRPRDVTPFRAQLAGLQAAAVPVRTDPRHLGGVGEAGAGGMGTQGVGTKEEDDGARSIDGNGVQIDSELMKVADTDAGQELVTDLFHKYANLYRIAMGR